LQFGEGSCFAGRLTVPTTSATDLVKILPSDGSFSFTAIAPDRIAIFSDVASPNPASITTVEGHIKDLAGSGLTAATSIPVPRGSAQKTVDKIQPDLPTDGSIVVKAVDRDCILLIAKDKADPIAVAGLKKSIAQFYWGQESSSPTQRLFYVDATAVVKKLATDSAKADSSTSKMPAANGAAASSTSSTASPTVSVSVAPGTASAKASPDDSSGKSPADASKNSDTAAPADGGSPSSKSMDATAKPATADKSKTMPAVPKPLTMQALNDTVVYSNDDGSDRGIFERNRLMAVLDLPRPEVLMNIWSLQASSGNYMTVNAEAEAARELIGHHNDLLQASINKGWDYLSRRMKDPAFFDKPFYQYITQKFNENQPDITRVFGEKEPDRKIEPALSQIEAQVCAQDIETAPVSSKSHPAKPVQSSGLAPKCAVPVTSSPSYPLPGFVGNNRERWGWCAADKYCLGFSHAFEPLRPTFTNLLIGIISAVDAYGTAQSTVNAMEKSSEFAMNDGCQTKPYGREDPCADPGTVDSFRQCIKDSDQQLHTFAVQSSNNCELSDRITMSEQILTGHEETLKLDCFREQVKQSFGPPPKENKSKDKAAKDDFVYSTTAAGLMRAAVADFLFNYKWATQYPHDFIPYDLTQSAQELNAEFNPLVLAFNRDVAAFTENLQSELQCKYTADIDRRESKGWFKKGDQTFISDGMLSVRGISGVESVVDTVTQSFFDATNPPSLTDLVKSVSDAEKNIPGVLQTNLTANEAAVLLGALNSVQPAQAKIGRQLSLDITPHALAGASSAELEVKLTAQETADPTRFTADKSAEDTLSRVAKHNVNTRVRVESLKLFEVSAFSALLQRPRSKFPILPPLFEVPYFGSFIGWPLPGAKVYHRSTAIVSAVIVPTAADLAFGIDFSADRFCIGEECRRAHSPQDFGSLPLRNFHKAMVQCFASSGRTPYTGVQIPAGSGGFHTDQNFPPTACTDLSLLRTNKGGVPPIE
jgi:hypothetical protein